MSKIGTTISLIIPFLFGAYTAVSAQTISEAQKLYEKGEYAQALPTFKRYVKSQPDNGNYNLWYGVCCFKTGNPEEALKYLQTAVKKKVPSGQLYLAQNYNSLYRFEEAVENYEAYIEDLTKRKRSTEEAEELLEQAKTNLRMLKSVEEVCIIDSFVVNKADFLQSYKLSDESGKLATYNDFFGTDGDNPGTIYVTEMADKMYFGSKDSDGKIDIYSSNKLMNEWSTPAKLSDRINGSGDANYPFVQPDGVTIYYASTGDGSIGGYDIFVSRYNSETDSYFTPENIGMPFNSPFNDYMYVEDEYNNLGWFASDRYQPDDKVCIYVFIPNSSKSSYDYESMDEDKIINLAKINAIKDSWAGHTDEVSEAKARLQEAMSEKVSNDTGSDFTFVIDDDTDYHTLNDFKAETAKALFIEWQNKMSDAMRIEQKLESERSKYAAADNDERNTMSAAILDMEQSLAKLRSEIETLSVRIRMEEKKSL